MFLDKVKEVFFKPVVGRGGTINQQFIDDYNADPTRDDDMKPYLKVGDVFAVLEEEDCITVIPIDEFDRNFTWSDIPDEDGLYPFKQHTLFLK